MNFNDIKDTKAQEILKKAGVTNEKLQNINSEKLNQILSDPEAVQKLMSTPAAQALLKRFKRD